MSVFFKIIGPISNIEKIASGRGIRERRRLSKVYGSHRWRKLKGTANVEFADGTMGHAEVHWYEAHGIGAKEFKIKRMLGIPMKRTDPKFVVCVKNKGYAAALELRKLYRVVADNDAARLHQIRVIDESGEDYLYPEEYFVAVQLPQSAEKAVRRATGLRS